MRGLTRLGDGVIDNVFMQAVDTSVIEVRRKKLESSAPSAKPTSERMSANIRYTAEIPSNATLMVVRVRMDPDLKAINTAVDISA